MLPIDQVFRTVQLTIMGRWNFLVLRLIRYFEGYGYRSEKEPLTNRQQRGGFLTDESRRLRRHHCFC
jgi:hypothetical protein